MLDRADRWSMGQSLWLDRDDRWSMRPSLWLDRGAIDGAWDPYFWLDTGGR